MNRIVGVEVGTMDGRKEGLEGMMEGTTVGWVGVIDGVLVGSNKTSYNEME